MGLFDWIGECIGWALNVLAEFIANGFSGILRFMGGSFVDIGKDSLSGLVSDVFDDDSTAQDDMGDIVDAVTNKMTVGWMHTLKEFKEGHSEITPEKAAEEVQKMWLLAKDELSTAAMLATVMEALSLGQIEGVMDVTKVTDTTLGMSTFANKVSMMGLETGVLTSYQRFLNKESPNVIPGPTDLIRMQLREVFDEDFRPELLLPGTGQVYKDAMKESGFNEYWSDSYWAAHWVLPSLGDLDEMLYRRHITIEEWRTMVRRNDYLPAWINRREKIIYKPYTRVDVRRMWDLAQLSEQEVLDNYKDLGYDELHATKMTIWTKLYVLAVELRARYSKGWITAAEVKSEVIAAGMAPARAEIWVQKIIKADQEDRMISERDLTKAEIVKGVKAGFLTVSEGVELLVDMGYDEAESEYIIAINVEAISGSPETLEEFQDIVNKRRKAMGLPIRKKESKTEETGTGSDKTTEVPTSKKK